MVDLGRTQKNGAATRVGLGILAGLSLPGCMSDALEVGRDPVQENGGSSGGGSGGIDPQAGRGGSAGASAGAGDGGSRQGDSGGTGGRGGRGGDGSLTSGDGGTRTGGAGGAEGIQFDADCDCTITEFEVSCTMSPAAFGARVDVPADCENDLDYVRRATCPGTLTRYRWQEGFENDYEVELDGTSLRYGSAFGYVSGLCDISGEFEESGVSITAGEPSGVTCMEECSVCEQWLDEGADRPPRACEPRCTADTTGQYATQTLDDYCAYHFCPRNLDEARQGMPAVCEPRSSSTAFSTLHSGCGFEVVERYVPFGTTWYYFDAETLLLVGASQSDDLPWGDCEVFEYRGGVVPAQPCDDATACALCTPMGEAGASGSDIEVCSPP